MKKLRRTIFPGIGILCFALVLANTGRAQNVSFNYFYIFEIGDATDLPELGGLPDFDFPDSARKNGVEGTLKASLMLGEDGKVRDIVITQGLPNGVDQAMTEALKKLYFKPARKNGKPVAVKMNLDFVITTAYDEGDKNVRKPKILAKPEPAYPEKHRAEGFKGKVQVGIIFYPDGKVKIIRINSVLPREFDLAAAEAAEKIKFEPAVHKKSKKPVAQALTVEFEFKP